MLSAKIQRGFHKLLRPGDRNSANRNDAPSRLSRNSCIDIKRPQSQDDFQYDALEPRNMFRFLTLLPGSGDDEIVCELSAHRLDFTTGAEALDHNLSYEALSYTWGSLTDMLGIKLHGKRKSVTKTLHSALLHLRYPAATRVLWVDAVCINQHDDQERSNQVMQMGLLYRFAKRVVAWIGEGEAGTSFGITLANALPRTIRGELDEEDPDLAAIARWVFGLEGRAPLNSESKYKQYVAMAWRVYDEIIARSWFRRVWIVQEVVLAADVIIQCGKRWIDFDILYLAIIKSSIFRESSQLIVLGENHGWTSLMGIGRLRGELNGQVDQYPDLLHLLSRFTYSEATDDRDRIYSFLGITHPSIEASEILSCGFAPDYSKPVPQVYKDFALFWMQTHKNLDLFSRIKDRGGPHQGKYHSKLPSWVPDWTHIDGFSPNFIDIQAPEKKPYHASESEPAGVSYDSEVDILFVNGFIFDSIAIVSDEPQWGESIGNPLSDNWRQWHAITLENPASGNPYATAEGRAEAYWRTLVAGCDSNGQPAPDAFGEQFYEWAGLKTTSTTSRSNDPPISGTSETAATDVAQGALRDIIVAGEAIGLCSRVDTADVGWRNEEGFKRQLFKTVNIRKIFVTERGYIGIGPDRVRVGDHIAILYGGKMPYVLRKRDGLLFSEPETETGSDNVAAFMVECHELIDGGECYIHGLMDGEAMHTLSSEEREGAQVLLV